MGSKIDSIVINCEESNPYFGNKVIDRPHIFLMDDTPRNHDEFNRLCGDQYRIQIKKRDDGTLLPGKSGELYKIKYCAIDEDKLSLLNGKLYKFDKDSSFSGDLTCMLDYKLESN